MPPECRFRGVEVTARIPAASLASAEREAARRRDKDAEEQPRRREEEELTEFRIAWRTFN